MIKKVDHIGVAVNSLDAVLKLYTEGLGLELEEIETSEEQKVRAAVIRVGDSKIELLESTDPDGPIARHTARRGEGLHHVALEVSDIEGTLAALEVRGIDLIDRQPRKGLGGRIAFLRPGGLKVLIELVEPEK